jgi:hypothetical protein
MPEREPIVDENRMPPGKAIAVDECSASDTAARKADAAEPGMCKAAAHSSEAMSTETMAAKPMPTKAPMAATPAVATAAR